MGNSDSAFPLAPGDTQLLNMTQLEGAGDALVKWLGMPCLWGRVCKSSSQDTAAIRPLLGLELGLSTAF